MFRFAIFHQEEDAEPAGGPPSSFGMMGWDFKKVALMMAIAAFAMAISTPVLFNALGFKDSVGRFRRFVVARWRAHSMEVMFVAASVIDSTDTFDAVPRSGGGEEVYHHAH